MNGRYTVGVDFGTLSARALVVEVATGRELESAVFTYPHAVMDEALPDGTPLKQDWALQHPQDYLDALAAAVPEALRRSGVSADDVIGVGIDFTACTLVAVDGDGVPLCMKPEYASEPHAYVKLWKHHAAQEEANRLNTIAAERGEAFLERYGGKISSEWLFPKVWQALNEAPGVYAAADLFMEAADWVIMRMTGELRRNSCTAGYKAIYHKREGYPSADFLKTLDKRLEHMVEEKLRGPVVPIGTRAGGLTPAAARLIGLNEGTAVAVANVDAHVSVPAAGITETGSMLMIMGTSTCHMVLAGEERIVPGMCGVVEDGILPGLLGFEAGQSCVGDHFEWAVERITPREYIDEAEKRGISPHQLLTEKAEALRPGQSGLLALDWWNGNRSVLVDVDLTGALLGMTLLTRAEEIYRALIEATAFGTRMIIETFRAHGVPVDALYACGGIAEKNPFVMQVYADVTGMEIRVARSAQAPALGSAMFAAVAAGKAAGGYDGIVDAARAMGGVKDAHYAPNPGNAAVYDKLYAEYKLVHDYFGRGGNDVMKRLKALKNN